MSARLCGSLAILVVLGACNSGGDEAAKSEKIELSLDVEIWNHADAILSLSGDDLTAKLTLDKGFGIVAEDRLELRGKGRVEHFPEADVALYTARFSVTPVSGGPCGDKPLSVALALHRRAAAPRFAGSLTAYCGENVWAGLPARNPLRLTGTLAGAAPAE